MERKIFCPYCGNEIEPGLRRCPYCRGDLLKALTPKGDGKHQNGNDVNDARYQNQPDEVPWDETINSDVATQEDQMENNTTSDINVTEADKEAAQISPIEEAETATQSSKQPDETIQQEPFTSPGNPKEQKQKRKGLFGRKKKEKAEKKIKADTDSLQDMAAGNNKEGIALTHTNKDQGNISEGRKNPKDTSMPENAARDRNDEPPTEQDENDTNEDRETNKTDTLEDEFAKLDAVKGKGYAENAYKPNKPETEETLPDGAWKKFLKYFAIISVILFVALVALYFI